MIKTEKYAMETRLFNQSNTTKLKNIYVLNKRRYHFSERPKTKKISTAIKVVARPNE